MTDEVDRALRPKKKRPRRKYLSSGSTLLNLACTGRPDGAFFAGGIYLVVGDSSSGKTFMTLTCFAEAMRSEAFKDYRLIFDNVENGAHMDFARYFGKKVAARVEAPGKDKKGNPRNSSTLEEFYDNVDDAGKDGRPFIYVLDSMDALQPEGEVKRQEDLKAVRKGEKKKAAGSMGAEKPKINSNGLRLANLAVKRTDSILVIISQTRQNMGFGAAFNPRTRSGGDALTFYSQYELWLSLKGKIKRKVNGKDRVIGKLTLCKLRKNRSTGKDRDVIIPIYNSVGLDDMTGMVFFLVQEGHWKARKEKADGPPDPDPVIEAPEFDFKGRAEALIQRLQLEDREDELRALVRQVWESIEEKLEVRRKPKYE